MIVDLDTVLRTATFLLSITALVAAWIATRRSDVEERFKKKADLIEAQRVRTDTVEMRLSRVEQHVDGMPRHSELHQLEVNLTQISGSLNTMNATLEGQREIMKRLEAIVGRHDDHLIGGNK